MTTFDDPDERARQVFTPIVRATLVVGAIGLGVITPFIAINKLGAAVLSLFIFAAAAIAWVLMRFERPRLGTAIIVGAFWVVQTGLLVFSQGGFIGSAYVFSTLLAGAALGSRAALIVGALGVAALAVTAALSLSGITPPIVFPAPLPARAGFAIAILAGAIWVLHVFIRRMETAFETAARELSERRRTEQEVQQRAADFEEAQRLAQSGSWDFDVATGVHRWSRQQFLIHGLDPDTTPASFRAMIERIAAEDQDRVAAAFQSVYAPPHYIRGEYRVFRAPGDLRVIDGRIEGVLDENRKVVRLRGVSVDITDQRRAEQLRELELSVARSLAGVDAMEPAVATALQTICERENWQIGGYWRADEQAGELVLEHWWYPPGFEAAAQPVIENGRRKNYSSGVGLLGQAWRTGSPMWVPDITQDSRVERAPLLSASGLHTVTVMPVTEGSRVIGVLSFSGTAIREPDQAFLRTFPVLASLVGQFVQRRRTEEQRRALQTQLYQSQKLQALGTLAGGIAHEFNNLIAAILGNASMALQDVGDDHPAKESLDQISAAGERARALTRRILMFGRAQPDTRKSISLTGLVEDAIRLLRATLPVRITLTVNGGQSIAPVRADATQLHQLVVNLCTNAAHAIGNESGNIAVSLSNVTTTSGGLPIAPDLPAGDYVCLSVTDTGAGIDPQIRDRIFEPFFTTKRAGEGAGLGLSVVHSIVQGHEGAIAVDSTPGEGTTFRVYLPAAQQPAALPAETQKAPAEQLDGKHVFYVDDDATIVSAIDRLLTRRGYRVSAFTSAKKALETLRSQPSAPHLFVSDYNMAEMSGLDVARDVLQLHPDLPVLIVSGFIDERVERSGRALGVREFVHKPDLLEMCAAIDRLAAATPAA